jgi:transcription elongation factor S-II
MMNMNIVMKINIKLNKQYKIKLIIQYNKMKIIKDHESFRKNIIINLESIISLNNAENLEKGIYNHSLDEANKLNVVKKWDNPYFVQLYINKLRSIYLNLKENPDLLEKINNKEFKSHELAYMTHQQIQPDKWEDLIQMKKIRDKNKYEPVLEASTDDFKCRKCKSKKCTYYQLQTRSADEPMTTFVTCLDCGNRWKC